MASEQERYDEVARLCEIHWTARFPERLKWVEVVPGVDMWLLDLETMGCVRTWLHAGGSLDDRRRRALAACIEELDLVLPLLDDEEERANYQRLRDMAALIESE